MNEQRLIDANTLVGADGLFSVRGCPGNCSVCRLWSEEGCRVILEAPTVDAVEVVHGHWIEINRRRDVEGWIECDYVCSSCSEISEDEHNYCPNCGAKMDDMIL